MTGFRSGDECLEAFSATPGLALLLAAPDGTFLFVNETFAKIFGGGTAEEHTGRNFTDLYPREWADEKVALLRRVAYEDERLLVRCIWEGKLLEAQYQRITGYDALDGQGDPDAHDAHDGQDGGEPRILVTVREGVTGDELLPEGLEIVRCDTSNFGPLKVLSPRELEVLALIGQGKPTKEIGEILGCSPRTVERHRDTLGKKLNKRDRVSLALVAQAAGLELGDAHVKHVDPLPKPEGHEPAAHKPGTQAEPKPQRPGVLHPPE